MKKIYGLAAVCALLLPDAAYAESKGIIAEYTDFKSYLSNEYNLTYDFDVSYMLQGANNGGQPVYQSIYSPTVTWTPLKSTKYGTGSFTFMYNVVSYISDANGDDMSNNLGIISSTNDYGSSGNTFYQLTYTHTLPNNKLGITIGQFPIFLFDGTQYNSNQQSGFINETLSQNASQAYASAGLGGYLTFNITDTISVNAGAQTANNIDAANMNFHDLDKKYTLFAAAAWNPTFAGWGSGTYSVLVYQQPDVPAQPDSSLGGSVNISQSLGEKWAVFASWNTASGDQVPISMGLNMGVIYNNPLNRNSNDQIGLGIAYNKVNSEANSPTEGTEMRKYETVLEAYWKWSFTDYLQVTPDIQFYYHPALDTSKDTAAVFSLRLTLAL